MLVNISLYALYLEDQDVVGILKSCLVTQILQHLFVIRHPEKRPLPSHIVLYYELSAIIPLNLSQRKSRPLCACPKNREESFDVIASCHQQSYVLCVSCTALCYINNFFILHSIQYLLQHILLQNSSACLRRCHIPLYISCKDLTYQCIEADLLLLCILS